MPTFLKMALWLAVWLAKHPSTSGRAEATTRTPRRIAKIYHPITVELIISTQEQRSQVVRASPRDGLCAGDTIVDNNWRVMSQYQARRARYIFGEAGDGKVLVIQRRVTQDDVRSLYSQQCFHE